MDTELRAIEIGLDPPLLVYGSLEPERQGTLKTSSLGSINYYHAVQVTASVDEANKPHGVDEHRCRRRPGKTRSRRPVSSPACCLRPPRAPIVMRYVVRGKSVHEWTRAWYDTALFVTARFAIVGIANGHGTKAELSQAHL